MPAGAPGAVAAWPIWPFKTSAGELRPLPDQRGRGRKGAVEVVGEPGGEHGAEHGHAGGYADLAEGRTGAGGDGGQGRLDGGHGGRGQAGVDQLEPHAGDDQPGDELALTVLVPVRRLMSQKPTATSTRPPQMSNLTGTKRSSAPVRGRKGRVIPVRSSRRTATPRTE